MALLNSPRCSLPDQDEPSKSLASEGEEGGNMKRRRRGITTWTRRDINWRFNNMIFFYNDSVLIWLAGTNYLKKISNWV